MICSNWVNPAKIVEFAANPTGPEERRRAPAPTLAQAMEMATEELASTPIPSSKPKQTQPAATRALVRPPTATSSSSTVASPSGVTVSVSSSQSKVASTTPRVSSTGVSSSTKLATEAVRSSNSLSSKTDLATPTRTSETSRQPIIVAKSSSTTAIAATAPSKPSKATVHVKSSGPSTLPSAMPKISDVNTSSASFAVKSNATATQTAVMLQHPQAVRASPFAPSPINTATASSPSQTNAYAAVTQNSKAKQTASTKNSKPKATSSATGSGSSTPNSNGNSGASTAMTTASDPAHSSVHSSRTPSPLRPPTTATKIVDPPRPIEEFNSYRGTAFVGNTTIAKPTALSWSGSKSGSQVDSLTVVSSLKQRLPDGHYVSTPTTERHFIGMQNLGNTCYINSAVQCLAAVVSFNSPLTSMLVSLEDAFRNSNSNPLMAAAAKATSNGRKKAVVEEVIQEVPRPSRRTRSQTVPTPPPALDKKARSRKSWIKYPDAPPHNPEDAKFNPLVASLVSILKTLAHPEYLIQHHDRSANASYPGCVGPDAHRFRGFPFNKNGNGSLHRHLNGSSSSNKSPHGIQQHLIANSSDEDMDVDPIGDDEASSSTTSSSSLIPTGNDKEEAHEAVPSKEVTKVLQAFQNSSGQLLDEKYYTDQHQDISEFILHLLEYMHDQLNTKKPLVAPPPQSPAPKKRAGSGNRPSQGPIESPRSLAHAQDYPKLSKLEMECKEWYHYMATNQSPVTDSFDGLLRRSRTCPKGHTFTSYEIFRILTLHFEDENAKECTLEDMFASIRKPEILDCRCSQCGGNDDKTFQQVTDVYILPKYLILTLGRFKGSASDQSWWAHKIKTRVKFPLDNLNMAPLFDIADGQPAPTYNLVAISNHKGSSIHGGHYFSYVRTWSNSEHWVCLNDNTVKEVRTDAIVSPQAYMLFYERQDAAHE